MPKEEENDEQQAQEFQLVSGDIITIPGAMLRYFNTLTTLMMEASPEVEGAPIPLIDASITAPIMKWIIDAYTIYIGENFAILDLDNIYVHAKTYSRLLALLNNTTEPLLTLFNNEGKLPTIDDLTLLSHVAQVLNWLDASILLVLVVEKMYSLIEVLPTDEIRALYIIKKRKQEDDREERNQLSFTPYYKREKLIASLLSQELPYDLIRANHALQKYINPITIEDKYIMFLTARNGLHEFEVGGTHFSKVNFKDGQPQLIASGARLTFCSTTTNALYLHSPIGYDDLGHQNKPHWSKTVAGRDEILLMSYGKLHGVILAIRGLFVIGSNAYGQLGLDNRIDSAGFTRIPTRGVVRAIYATDNRTFILTTEGLYGTGNNIFNSLSVGSGSPQVLKLTPLIGVEGDVLNVSSGVQHTMIVTTLGLYGIGGGTSGVFGTGNQASLQVLTNLTDKVDGKPLAVYCGGSYTVVLTTTGLYATGDNTDGRLGVGVDNSTIRKEKFTKMIGYDGDVHSVTCMRNATIILTTTGVYLAGNKLGMKFATTVPQGEKVYQFYKIVFEMDYFTKPSTTISIVTDEPSKKRTKLQCDHCRGRARFISSHYDRPYCSKLCSYTSNNNKK